MSLRKIKIVDLKRTKWDKEKSNPERGEYVFTGDIIYVLSGDYLNQDTRHPWKFKWVRHDPRNDYREYWDFKTKLGAEFVTTADPYWPEGVPATEEGKFRYGDAILIKIPLEKYVEKRANDIEKAEIQSRSVRQKFRRQVEQSGSQVSEETYEQVFAKPRR